MQIKSNIQTIIPRMALAVAGFAFFLIMLCPTTEIVSADDSTPSTQSTTSSLGVSLSDIPVLEVQPNTSGLTTATSTSQLNVTTTDIEKFSVYVSTTNGTNTLVGKYPGNTQVINPVSSASQLSAFSANTWGYSLATSAPTSTTLFSAVPTTNTNPVLADVIPSGNDNFYLSIGTAIDLSLPTDTYKNELTVSVIATPLITVFGGITTMQEMTQSICMNASIGDTNQLIDVRDNKEYWVAKLADENCWMTQNLDLDLNENTLPLTPATSDVTTEWAGASSSFRDVGIVVLKQPNSGIGAGCDITAESMKSCSIMLDVSNMTDDYVATRANTTDNLWYSVSDNGAGNSYDAHYTLGNYYMPTDATAGSINSLTTDGEIAPQSICPKGWKLPLGGPSYNTSDSFYNLLSKYASPNGGGTLVTGSEENVAALSAPDLYEAPLYLVRGGYQEWGVAIGLGATGLYHSRAYTFITDGPSPDPIPGLYGLSFSQSRIDPGTQQGNAYAFVRCML